MTSGDRRGEAWPQHRVRAVERLPRIEDLPAAQDGYERESVRAAFDSFYRHLAQVDSTVRALDAVEIFRDQAGELRRELRALRSAGWVQQPWPAPRAHRSSPGLPEWLPRFAAEVAFLVVTAVAVVAAGFDRLSIVLVMALAWAIVGTVEWAASRERFVRGAAAMPDRAPQAHPPVSRRTPSQEPAAPRVEPWPRGNGIRPVDEAHTLVRRNATAPPPARSSEHEPVFGIANPEAGDGSSSTHEQSSADDGGEPRFARVSPSRIFPEARRALRQRRRRMALVTLAVATVPGGIASASLLREGDNTNPAAAEARVVRHTPRPRAVGPDAIGPNVGEARPLQTTAVVRASRGDSWVELRANSAQGRELYAGLLAHGRFVHVRSGRVWLRLGAASNVEVRVNGKQVGPLFGTVAVLLTPRGFARIGEV